MPDIVILIIVSTRCRLSPDIYNSISMFRDSSLHKSIPMPGLLRDIENRNQGVPRSKFAPRARSSQKH